MISIKMTGKYNQLNIYNQALKNMQQLHQTAIEPLHQKQKSSLLAPDVIRNHGYHTLCLGKFNLIHIKIHTLCL